jgi:hypothetical protein
MARGTPRHGEARSRAGIVCGPHYPSGVTHREAVPAFALVALKRDLFQPAHAGTPVRTGALPFPLRAWTIMPDAALGVARLLPGLGAVHTWRVLRCLALWIVEDRACAPPFDGRGMQALEEQILTSGYDDAIRLPLAVIARSLTPGAEDADLERMAYACLCVAEWAHGRGLYSVATSFADASALATGLERYAEVAARLRRAVESREAPRPGQVR